MDALVAMEGSRLPRFLWEPACGPGAIVRALGRHGKVVRGSDVVNYGSRYQHEARLDFLAFDAGSSNAYLKWDGIVTNPPYTHAEEFVQLARQRVPYVAMLLRLAFLEGEGRGVRLYAQPGLARVHVFTRRLPRMHREDWEGPKTDTETKAFAWFVWERGHAEPATIHHVDWKETATPKALAALKTNEVAA